MCTLDTRDSHCHLLLGLKSLDLSVEASQAAAKDAIEAIESGNGVPKLLDDSELFSAQIANRVRSFLISKVKCFDFYSTCYKDAKCAYEVLTAYKDDFAKADKIAHLGVGLHPYFLSEDYAQELDAICMLIEHIRQSSPELIFGLGEIGLDRRLNLSMEIQCQFIKDFIDRTVHYDLPYSFHCVRAYNELDSLLTSYTASKKSSCLDVVPPHRSPSSKLTPRHLSDLKVIIHGFNGSVATAADLMGKSYVLGIGQAILSEQNHRKFHAIIKASNQSPCDVMREVELALEGEEPSVAELMTKVDAIPKIEPERMFRSGGILLETDYDGSRAEAYDGGLLDRIYEHYISLVKKTR